MFASDLFIKIKKLFSTERFNSMHEKDLTLDKYSDDESELFVLTKAIPSTAWPESIETSKGTYRFRCNEVFPPWAVGSYLGYAKYARTKE